MCYLIKGVKKYRDIKATVKQGREPTSGHTHVLVNSQAKEKQHVTNMGPSVIKKSTIKHRGLIHGVSSMGLQHKQLQF